MATQTERMHSTDRVVLNATADTGVLSKVISAIQAKTEFPVKPESSLESLGLDSISLAEITLDLETMFNIRTDEQLLEANTVADVAKYVDAERSKPKAK